MSLFTSQPRAELTFLKPPTAQLSALGGDRQQGAPCGGQAHTDPHTGWPGSGTLPSSCPSDSHTHTQETRRTGCQQAGSSLRARGQQRPEPASLGAPPQCLAGIICISSVKGTCVPGRRSGRTPRAGLASWAPDTGWLHRRWESREGTLIPGSCPFR